MLRKLMLASKPLILNTWHRWNEAGQYTLGWFLNTLKDLIRPAYIWRKFDQNQCVFAVCVLVCTLVAFVRLFELPPGQEKKVLAFFNFQKWLFVSPEIWLHSIKLKKNVFSIPWNFYIHAVFQLLVYCFKHNKF